MPRDMISELQRLQISPQHWIALTQNHKTERFKSSNLLSLPTPGRKSKVRTYKCLLCGEMLRSIHFAEIHMRSVHGEGGREVSHI